VTTLYDHRGEPIRTAELKGEPQTAKVGHLAREFADHPSRGLTPAKLARILEQAEQGDLTAQAHLAEDMEEKDAHLYAELSKRKRAVLSVGWDLALPREATAREKDAAALITDMLHTLDFEDLLLDLAAGILPGYACVEIEWDRSGGQWFPRGLHYRPPSWFMSPLDDRGALRLRTAAAGGEELRPWGWVAHLHRAKSGYLGRAALARVLAWPFLFRNYAARDLAEFLEIYGLPLRLGTFPPGSSDQEKSTLMRAVVSIGHAAAGIIPEGMKIEFHEAAKGASDPFMAMTNWAEKSMSKAILGGTLTSQTDEGGAYALGEVHQDVFKDIVQSDLRQYAQTLNRDLVRPLALLNTDAERPPRLVFDAETPEDLKLFSEAIPKLVGAGMRIPERWAREKLHIPEPDNNEPVLEQTGLGAAALKGHLAAASAAMNPETDVPDLQTARLAREAEDPLADMVEAIRTIVNDAASLEDLRGKLVLAWPAMDASALAEVMAEALAAAQMAGRYDILEEL